MGISSGIAASRLGVLPGSRTTSSSANLLVSACPKAGCFRQPLNPSDSDYQVTSHSSSGESSATQLPPLKTVLG